MKDYHAERISMDNITRPVPRMRTIKETAAELNVPVYALRQWVKSGAIPAVYCGKKALLNLDLVIKFLEIENSNGNLSLQSHQLETEDDDEEKINLFIRVKYEDGYEYIKETN